MDHKSFYPRTVFSQLLIGSLVASAGVAILWLVANTSFMRAMDRANERRWMAGAVANQLLQTRLQEKDFLLRDAADSSFLKTGKAISLEDHAASLELLNNWIDSLAKLSEGDTAVVQLRQSVKVYGTSFVNLASASHSQLVDTAGRLADSTALNQMHERMNAAIGNIDPLLATIIVESIQDSNKARMSLVAAVPLIIVIGIILAAAFFYLFGITVSRMAKDIERAANDIGRGQFSSRVNLKASNELGRIATAFNRMADNLAALVKAVHQSSTQINDSVEEISSSSREQQATAMEVAATTSEVEATAKVITSTSRELAGTVKEVAAVADETATLAGTGQTGLTQLDMTMRQIAKASDDINDRLTVLSEKAGTITSVVTTIVKVADQTNLLSLNAAIEAEKAGEYGRGFAVVAVEIRRLADQTAGATSNIETIIKEMQSAVTAGVMGMDKFAEEIRLGVEVSTRVSGQLSEIIKKVQALAPHLELVNNGMQSQNQGAQQISETLTQLSLSVQQTTDSLSHSNRAIERLNQASQNLQAGVLHFTVVS